MSDVKSFEDYVADKTPHDYAELICVGCGHRWIGCWPTGTWLKELYCPNCSRKGLVITTGQYIEETDL